MAKEEEHGSHPAPRWEIVTKAYDMIDADMDKMVNDLSMNYFCLLYTSDAADE